MIDDKYIKGVIKDKLFDAVTEIQARYNIHSGDISPLLKVDYDNAEAKLIQCFIDIISAQIWNEKQYNPSLGFSEANWQSCLETLGFTERKNPNGRDCYDIFNVDDIPCWQYEGREQQQNLYFFFSGMVAMQLRQ